MAEKAGVLATIADALGRRLTRNDNWANKLTGMGTSSDRTTHSRFQQGETLSDQQLAYMFAHEDLAGKIVDIYPREEIRKGWRIGSLDGEAEIDAVREYLEPFAVNATVLDARIWGRLFGGAVIMLGFADGRDPSEPLGTYDSVDFIKVYDKRWVVPVWSDFTYAMTPYGIPDTSALRPSQFQIVSITGLPIGRVHSDRLVFFGGARTDQLTKRWRKGWDYSVLQKPFDALRANGVMWQGIEALVGEASQAVYKIKGLMAQVAAGKVDALLGRLAVLDQTRSTTRAVVLDQENEEFERQQLTFAGLNDIGSTALKRVAAAAEIPVTVLLAEPPGGLNATGDSDMRWFLQRVEANREWELEPPLKRLLGLLLAARSSPVAERITSRNPKTRLPIDLTWESLWMPSATEFSTIRLNQANADVAYINAGVLSAQEVALSRFQNDGWSPETNIDRDVHQAALEADNELLLNPPKPPPAPPPLPPGQLSPMPAEPPAEKIASGEPDQQPAGKSPQPAETTVSPPK